MNNLTKWNFENSEVRTLTIENEPYFVGKDVADVLGYNNTKDALSRHVDSEDKTVIQRSENTTLEIPNRGLTVVNESGLYSLILSSKLPTAKKFKRWVTSEVLPSIRRKGMYATDELIANPDLAIKAFMALKEEREKTKALNETVAVQTQQIAELKPKASYYDVVLNCKDLISVTEIAKDYGKTAQWLNNILHEEGIQYKQGNKIWLLYKKYADKGYTNTKTQTFNGSDGKVHTKVHTYWTQKGRLFIYDLLKKQCVLPLIELSNDN